MNNHPTLPGINLIFLPSCKWLRRLQLLGWQVCELATSWMVGYCVVIFGFAKAAIFRQITVRDYIVVYFSR